MRWIIIGPTILALVSVYVLASGALGQEGTCMDKVPFFDTPEIRAELPVLAERFQWPEARKLEAMQVERTPRVQRILDESAAYLLLLLAPEAAPNNIKERLVPLHSENADRVRLRRFKHGEWVVDASVQSNAISVAVTSTTGRRVKGVEPLKKFVLKAAQELFVGKGSYLSGVTCVGVRETSYGIRGYLRPVVRDMDQSRRMVIEGRRLDGWPYGTMAFLTDGVSVLFNTPKPPGRAVIGKNLPGPLEEVRADWFRGTEAERASEAVYGK